MFDYTKDVSILMDETKTLSERNTSVLIIENLISSLVAAYSFALKTIKNPHVKSLIIISVKRIQKKVEQILADYEKLNEG